MRMRQVFPLAVLLLSSMGAAAADVEYQHPNVTIVATDEPLDSVLRSVAKEMRIFVTTPAGLNPVINCDIQDLPIKKAFKKLLGDMSYSLEWKDDGELLVGVTILAGSDESFSETQSRANIGVATAAQAAPTPSPSVDNGHVVHGGDTATAPMNDDHIAAERDAMDARMAQEREQNEAAIEQLRQEADIAHEKRMVDAAVRSEAGMSEYLQQSQGL